MITVTPLVILIFIMVKVTIMTRDNETANDELRPTWSKVKPVKCRPTDVQRLVG